MARIERAGKPLVGIIMGSGSDSRIMKSAAVVLDRFGITHEDRIVSAHRTLQGSQSMHGMPRRWDSA